MARLLGIDPGLRITGWGVIEVDGNHLRHIADGVIATDSATSVPQRLKALHDALVTLMAQYRPDEAAIEETYVNRNGTATLKLGYARGVALLAPAGSSITLTAPVSATLFDRRLIVNLAVESRQNNRAACESANC